MSSGPTLERLLELYREALDEAKQCDLAPAPGFLEEIVKSHIRELARKGCNGSAIRNRYQKCPKNWIPCDDYCVPAEVGCGEASITESASPVQH
jgi:hypothetical protein